MDNVFIQGNVPAEAPPAPIIPPYSPTASSSSDSEPESPTPKSTDLENFGESDCSLNPRSGTPARSSSSDICASFNCIDHPRNREKRQYCSSADSESSDECENSRRKRGKFVLKAGPSTVKTKATQTCNEIYEREIIDKLLQSHSSASDRPNQMQMNKELQPSTSASTMISHPVRISARRSPQIPLVVGVHTDDKPTTSHNQGAFDLANSFKINDDSFSRYRLLNIATNGRASQVVKSLPVPKED